MSSSQLSPSATGEPRRRGRRSAPERRAALLDLAAARFAKHGYHGTSIRDLADAAGMNAATIYHYFKSKEDALFEVCLAGSKGAAERIEHIIDTNSTMIDRLSEIIRRQMDDLAAHSDYRNVYFEQRVHLNADQRAIISQQTRRIRQLLDRLFTDAREQGELHPDLAPREASFVFSAMLRALTQYYVDGPIRGFDAIAKAMFETNLRGLVADPAAMQKREGADSSAC